MIDNLPAFIAICLFQAIASTISALVPTHGAANSDEEKRVIVSAIPFSFNVHCLVLYRSYMIIRDRK